MEQWCCIAAVWISIWSAVVACRNTPSAVEGRCGSVDTAVATATVCRRQKECADERPTPLLANSSSSSSSQRRSTVPDVSAPLCEARRHRHYISSLTAAVFVLDADVQRVKMEAVNHFELTGIYTHRCRLIYTVCPHVNITATIRRHAVSTTAQ